MLRNEGKEGEEERERGRKKNWHERVRDEQDREMKSKNAIP